MEEKEPMFEIIDRPPEPGWATRERVFEACVEALSARVPDEDYELGQHVRAGYEG